MIHRVRISFLLAAVLFCITYSEAPARQCPPQQTVTLAMDLAPDTDFGRRVRELYTEFFSRIGWCVEFRFTTLARSMEQVSMGKFDGDFFRIRQYGDRVSNVLRVDEPLSVTQYCIYVRDPGFMTLNDKDSFLAWSGAPLRIGYSKGSLIGEEVLAWLEAHTSHRLFNIPDQYRGTQMLRQGRLDVFLGTRVPADVLFGGNAESGETILMSGVFASEPGYMYLNKRLSHLVPALERVIREIKADGTFQRIIGVAPPLVPAKGNDRPK